MQAERRQQILSMLNQYKFVTVHRLCEALYASPATIRRDLAEMDDQGILTRLRGGAELKGGSNSDMPLLLRMQKERAKKEVIAALALACLEKATTVFMDSSSTVCYLARLLKDYSGKSIITNGISTINYLNEQTTATAYCTGGRLFQQSGYVGSHAINTVNAFYADMLFFSCCGFSAEHGSSEAEEENAMIKRAMIKNAKRRILLCDSTKFGHDYFCRACGTEDVDLIITDRYPGEAAAAALQNKLIYKE